MACQEEPQPACTEIVYCTTTMAVRPLASAKPTLNASRTRPCCGRPASSPSRGSYPAIASSSVAIWKTPSLESSPLFGVQSEQPTKCMDSEITSYSIFIRIVVSCVDNSNNRLMKRHPLMELESSCQRMSSACVPNRASSRAVRYRTRDAWVLPQRSNSQRTDCRKRRIARSSPLKFDGGLPRPRGNAT